MPVSDLSETKPFGQMEVHPLHGISNRILGLVSALLVARELQMRVLIDWRMDDSKFINAPMRFLLETEWLPAEVTMMHARRLPTNRCDAYYRQREAGWHRRSLHERAAVLNGYSIHKYFAGGGFAEPRPGQQLIEFISGSLNQCNATTLKRAVAGARKRPRLPNVPLEGCMAYFRGFEAMRSCVDRQALVEALSLNSSMHNTRPLRLGISLWSPIAPLNGTCAFAILPPSIPVLRAVRWLPLGTLGVHVRRGDFDQRWQRASDEEWFQAVIQTMALHSLKYIFVASDDPQVHRIFVSRFGQDIVLPRFLSKEQLPREPTKREWMSTLWTMQGNSASLAEQITLGTADFILGSWGSTYSTLAAAWFDRPIEYLPRTKARHCANATSFAPCNWRGHPNNPSPTWDHGQKCGTPLLRLVTDLRQAKNPDTLLHTFLKRVQRRPGRFAQAVTYARHLAGFKDRVSPKDKVAALRDHKFKSAQSGVKSPRRR